MESADFDRRLKRVLERSFPSARAEVGRFHGAERAHGHLVWDGFRDMDSMDRQDAVWKVLRDELGTEAQSVSVILTYTPEEMEFMAAA